MSYQTFKQNVRSTRNEQSVDEFEKFVRSLGKQVNQESTHTFYADSESERSIISYASVRSRFTEPPSLLGSTSKLSDLSRQSDLLESSRLRAFNEESDSVNHSVIKQHAPHYAIASHYQDHTLTYQRTQNNAKTSHDLTRVQNKERTFSTLMKEVL